MGWGGRDRPHITQITHLHALRLCHRLTLLHTLSFRTSFLLLDFPCAFAFASRRHFAATPLFLKVGEGESESERVVREGEGEVVGCVVLRLVG